MPQKLGMIGMGLMGQAFIRNLHNSQFIIQGFDVDATRMNDLRNEGGVPVESPAKAAQGVKFVIMSLPNSEIAHDVLFGTEGIVEGASKGLYVCDTTTARPSDSEAIAAELRNRGIKYLDSAVSGTSVMAEEGDLIVIAGGKKEDFEVCKPIFSGFSREAYLMGPSGSGARTKLIINLILAGNRLALAEGLILGEKGGLELQNLLEVLKDGACYSKTMVDKGPKMINADYSKQGQVKFSLKDARLMIELGQQLGAPILMTGLYSQILQIAFEKGYSEKDTVAFYEIMRGMAGLEERQGSDKVPFGKDTKM